MSASHLFLVVSFNPNSFSSYFFVFKNSTENTPLFPQKN
nr:MAG TPA: hypothetical protein [Caudoviricetes sp.]